MEGDPMAVVRESAKGVDRFCGGLVDDDLEAEGGGGRRRGGTGAVRRERGQRCGLGKEQCACIQHGN